MLLSFETYWKHPNLESIFLLFYDNWTQHTLTHAYTQKTHTHTDRQTAVVWKKVNGKKLLVSKQQQQKHSVEQQQV